MASFTLSLPLPFLLLSIAFLPFFVCGKGGFSVELIHRDSPGSPVYDASSTPYSRLKAAASRSRSRAIYFRNSMKKHPELLSGSSNGDSIFHSDIYSVDFEYLMGFYLGYPPRKILAIADTGSDLVWVQCKPCEHCFNQTAPLFDPQASSTYETISCKNDTCLSLPRRSCSTLSQCLYKYSYGDNSVVTGILSSETVSFDSTNGSGHVDFPATLFGCTHYSNGSFTGHEAGLVGLGAGKLSLIRQLGPKIDSKFSYCLPSVNLNSTTSQLKFGSSAVVSGNNTVTTPLIQGTPDTFYILSLEQIIVEGQDGITVNPAMPSGQSSSSSATKGNIIIDSGTVLTIIDDEALQSMVSKVASNVSLPRVVDTSGTFNLCFNVSGYATDASFPDITFRFAGGALVVLHPSNAFVAIEDNVVCLAMISSKELGINIFGSIAQQNFRIEYDLGAMQLTLEATDCAKL